MFFLLFVFGCVVAIELLAEVGDARVCEVFTVDNFMVHFHLKAEADDFEETLPVKFGGFGEQTHHMPMRAYVPGIRHRELWPAYNLNLAPPQASTEGLFQQTQGFASQ